jgi:hypothetical protein
MILTISNYEFNDERIKKISTNFVIFDLVE